MTQIFKREFAAYFHSLTGYIFIMLFLLFTGIYFMGVNMYSGYPMFSATLGQMMFVFLLLVPILTMRCFSEEKRLKTDQMLLTAPVRVTGIVLGKYLAMVAVFAIPMAVTLVFPFVIKAVGNWYPKSDYAAIIAFFLFGCMLIAIGMFLSALTESQMIAAASTFGVMLLLYLWSSLVDFIPETVIASIVGFAILIVVVSLLVYAASGSEKLTGAIMIAGFAVLIIFIAVNREGLAGTFPAMLGKLEVFNMFKNFAINQILDWEAIVRYVSIGFVFIFLTIQSIQKRRYN